MTTEPYAEIGYEVKDPLAVIRLNRPDFLNALTFRTLEEISSAVHQAEADPEVMAIAITGAGSGFCSGLDFTALGDVVDSPEQYFTVDPDDPAPGLFTYLLTIDKPVIAAINGVVAGGGFVLATMCDLRFAGPGARFVTGFSKLGLPAENGTSWVLSRLVGSGRALDLLWSPRPVAAEEAHRIGLVEFLIEGDDVLGAVREYVEEMAERRVSPASLRAMKRAVYRHAATDYRTALTEAIAATLESFQGEVGEGARAFQEKRRPVFSRLPASCD